MFWKIIRPGYWIWRRRFRSTNPLLMFLIVTGVVVAGYFAIDFLFSQIGDALANDAIVDVIAAFLPIQLYVFLLFAVLGIGDVLNQLYYASDLQFLFVAPIPLRITYFIKLLQAARGTIVPALLLGGFLVSFGLAQQLSWIYYPILFLLILALVAITASFSIILVVLMVRFMPSKGMSSAMPVVVFILTLGLVLGQQAISEWIGSQTALIEAISDALLDPAKLFTLSLIPIGLALLMNIIAYLVFTYAFQNAWDNIRQNTRASDGTIFDRPRPEQWWLQSIPQALYSLLIKEMIELRRDTRSIITLIQPFAMLIAVMILLPSGGKLAEIEIPLRFWILALFTVLYLTFLPSGMSLTALAKEGGNIHLYRSIAIKMSFLLWAKFIVICLPMLFLWTSFFVISGIVFEMAIWQIVALSGLATWLIIGTSLTSLIATGLNVNFAIEEVKKRVSGLVNFMLSSLNIIFASVSFLILCWIVVKVFPETATVTFISSLQILDWLFVENSLIPVLFLGILVIYWLSLSFGWASARNRLTTIE